MTILCLEEGTSEYSETEIIIQCVNINVPSPGHGGCNSDEPSWTRIVELNNICLSMRKCPSYWSKTFPQFQTPAHLNVKFRFKKL